MVIKIPFIGIDYLVKYFSNMLFYPFQYSIRYISSLFVSLIYMLICITCGLKLFGNYRGIEKKIIDENKIKSVDEEYKYLDKLIRIVIYLAVLIPLFILLIVCIILFILSVYIVITGVKLIGVSIIFLGLIMILISVIKLFRDGLNNKRDSRLLKLSVSSLVFIFGCLYTVYNFSTFKTNEDFNYSEMDTVTDSLELKLDDINTKVLVRNGNYELVKDSTLQDNNIRIEATYYDDYVDILYGQEKIGEIRHDLNDLDKEKVLSIAKEKSNEIKDKCQDLVDLAIDKGTPVLKNAAVEVRDKTVDVMKDMIKKLEDVNLDDNQKQENHSKKDGVCAYTLSMMKLLDYLYKNNDYENID